LHVDVRGRLNLCCQHAGVPSEDARDVAGDLTEMPLVDAHRKLVRIMSDAQDAKLSAIAEGSLDEWDHFPCNHCLKSFGKPHWTSSGADGPAARRERWVGAWKKDPSSDGSSVSDGERGERKKLPLLKQKNFETGLGTRHRA
jgi:hypothetical protein